LICVRSWLGDLKAILSILLELNQATVQRIIIRTKIWWH